MHISDLIFGEARGNAPARHFVDPTTPVLVGVVDRDGKSVVIATTYAEAERVHQELGQTLARMMRKRGSSSPPGGDTGGTHAAIQAAA